MDEAKKIGLDFDELQEYGFNFKDAFCGNSCPSRRSLFDFDKIMNGDSGELLKSGLVRRYQDVIRYASCHPKTKDYMTPRV